MGRKKVLTPDQKMRRQQAAAFLEEVEDFVQVARNQFQYYDTRLILQLYQDYILRQKIQQKESLENILRNISGNPPENIPKRNLKEILRKLPTKNWSTEELDPEEGTDQDREKALGTMQHDFLEDLPGEYEESMNEDLLQNTGNLGSIIQGVRLSQADIDLYLSGPDIPDKEEEPDGMGEAAILSDNGQQATAEAPARQD